MKISEILDRMKIEDQCNIQNDDNFEVLGLVGAITKKDLCTFLDSEKYIASISKNTKMVITTEELADKIKSCGVCITKNPRILFFLIHNFLQNDKDYTRKVEKTRIGRNCKISKMSFISENNVCIGNNVIIEEFVSIKENTIIGDNSIVRAGTIIGGEGFEFKRFDNKIIPVKHLGGVIIGNNVEIQHNTCVDKAIYPWDDTIIGDYVKIDNLVHIAHAVKVNSCTLIVANTGIGGRVEIGANSWIGFGATIRNGIVIGNEASVNMGAVVTRTVTDKESVSGNFAIEHSKFIEFIKSFK